MGTLVKETFPLRVEGRYNESFEVQAGKTLKCETSPDGIEVFADTVPVGKKWVARLYVHVTEVDA